MNRITLLIIAALSTVVAVAGLTTNNDEPVNFDGPPAEQPSYAAEETPALVDSEILELRVREPELIEQALTSTTSTTTSSTTTTTTTTTTSAPTTTSPESSSGGPSESTSSTSTTTTEPPSTTTTTQAGGFVASAESEFASSINSYRSSNGLAGLSRSGALDSYARSWAEQMAASGQLDHSNFGSLLGQWSAVGENIGVGYSVSAIFGAFVDSPDHESSIVGDFTHVGIGVYQDADGALWTTHVFAR